MYSLILLFISVLYPIMGTGFIPIGEGKSNLEIRELIASADSGDSQSAFDLAERFRFANGVEPSNTKMFKYYKLAAKAGNTQAQYVTGSLYFWGTGVPTNKVEAITWFKKAAGKNHPAAQHDLGYCYAQGIALEKDPKMAAYWYIKSAMQDHKPSQFNLANAYYNGIGITQNLTNACIWAHMSGNTKVLKKIHLELSPQQIQEAKDKAFQTLKDIRIKRIKTHKALN